MRYQLNKHWGYTVIYVKEITTAFHVYCLKRQLNDHTLIGRSNGPYTRGMTTKEDRNVETNRMNENASCTIRYCIKSLPVVVKRVVGGTDVVGNVVRR